MSWVRFVRTGARRAGFLIDYRTPQTDTGLRLAVMLAANEVDHVLDIGANKGDFARELFANGFIGRITSFEPLPRAHAELIKHSRRSPRWTISDRLALSDKSGEADFHEASSDLSSSLLPFDSAYDGGMNMVATHKVSTARLDDLSVDGRLFIKIDTQGSELAILTGGIKTLKRAVGVQVEMSLVSLYEGQALAPEVKDLIEGLGFQLWDVIAAYRDHHTQRLLQFDGVYFRAASGATGGF